MDRLLWQERALFEYWAHEASIVLTEDYPIHAYRMRHYPMSIAWGKLIQQWIDSDPERFEQMRSHLLSEFKAKGGLPSRVFEDQSRGGESSGWTSGRMINRMIDYLWQRGEVMVVRREGNHRIWGIADDFLPDWTPRETLEATELTRRAMLKALGALGIATPSQITQHYTRRRYPELNATLKALEHDGLIQRVQIADWKGTWYLSRDALHALEAPWQGRTTLLSPFDNLICDRNRTEQMFNFLFRIEIYVPKPKRQYGYYVLPILHDDRLIGRIDPSFDRKQKRLTIHNVYAEADAPDHGETVQAIRAAIEDLGRWLQADRIDYTDSIPSQWSSLGKG
ncbi:MAG: winged helix DNA-binding domain-containing protein [Anaerolineae bacterium]|nr:winged helix DNA-binding domain-containing protein [Anaerolineae bacterium]